MQKFLLLILLFITDKVVTGQIPVDSIRAIIKREVAARRSKSIIVGIVDSTGNRQIFAEGIISDNDPRKPDENTLYEIGSITKVFTSLLLANMSLNHQLRLNDPISKYLPENVRVPLLKDIFSTFYVLIGFSFGRRITPTDRIYNKLWYL